MENWTVKSVNGKEINTPEAATPEVAAPEVAVEQSPAGLTADEKIEVAPEVVEQPKTQVDDDGVIRINLDEPPTPVKKEENEQQVSNEQQAEQVEQPVQESGNTEEISAPLELITEEKSQEENLKVEEPVAIHEEQIKEVEALPEGIDGLVDFMKETGGTLEDYLNLNRDYEDANPGELMYEYYKTTKPHLNDEEINFLMDDKFGWDDDASEKEVTKKKLQFKEELYDAKKYLNGQKDKYYKDLKFNNVAPEYQEAYEFHNNYKQSQEANQKLVDTFAQKTNQVFNEDFKGFDFQVGDNKYRYKVQDATKTKEYQSDINNFIGEFLGEDGSISDAAGYHKAMFAAKNADKLAQHFYEQGRADAIKKSAMEAKNINMDPRQDMTARNIPQSGPKVRAVDNDGFNGKLRFKHYNNR